MNLRALSKLCLGRGYGRISDIYRYTHVQHAVELAHPDRSVDMLLFLCFSSLVVGILARLLQPFHGVGTALASGIIASLIILYLVAGSLHGCHGAGIWPAWHSGYNRFLPLWRLARS